MNKAKATKNMKIMKSITKIEELTTKEENIEMIELARREDLIKRLNASRYNNLKLFSLKPKGDTNC